MITSIVYTNQEETEVKVVTDSGEIYNTKYPSSVIRINDKINEWISQGNTITQYSAPLPLTNQELIDSSVIATDPVFIAFFKECAAQFGITAAQLKANVLGRM